MGYIQKIYYFCNDEAKGSSRHFGKKKRYAYLVMTRVYLPMMNGLMYVTKNGEQMLYFGELAGDGDYDDEPLTIHWPDGSTDVIAVKNKAYLSSADRKFKLNGKVVIKDTNRPVINIVK